jgi:hypothetical protein
MAHAHFSARDLDPTCVLCVVAETFAPLEGGQAVLVVALLEGDGRSHRFVGAIRAYHGERPEGLRVGDVLEIGAHRHLRESAALECGRGLAVEFHHRGRVARDAARRARR